MAISGQVQSPTHDVRYPVLILCYKISLRASNFSSVLKSVVLGCSHIPIQFAAGPEAISNPQAVRPVHSSRNRTSHCFWLGIIWLSCQRCRVRFIHNGDTQVGSRYRCPRESCCNYSMAAFSHSHTSGVNHFQRCPDITPGRRHGSLKGVNDDLAIPVSCSIGSFCISKDLPFYSSHYQGHLRARSTIGRETVTPRSGTRPIRSTVSVLSISSRIYRQETAVDRIDLVQS